MARRGAAGEVAPQEFGSSVGRGLEHRLLARALKTPALIEVRKLLGPLPHTLQAGKREGGSRGRKQAGERGWTIIRSLD